MKRLIDHSLDIVFLVVLVVMISTSTITSKEQGGLYAHIAFILLFSCIYLLGRANKHLKD